MSDYWYSACGGSTNTFGTLKERSGGQMYVRDDIQVLQATHIRRYASLILQSKQNMRSTVMIFD